jgi:hypothetical protein
MEKARTGTEVRPGWPGVIKNLWRAKLESDYPKWPGFEDVPNTSPRTLVIYDKAPLGGSSQTRTVEVKYTGTQGGAKMYAGKDGKQYSFKDGEWRDAFATNPFGIGKQNITEVGGPEDSQPDVAPPAGGSGGGGGGGGGSGGVTPPTPMVTEKLPLEVGAALDAPARSNWQMQDGGPLDAMRGKGTFPAVLGGITAALQDKYAKDKFRSRLDKHYGGVNWDDMSYKRPVSAMEQAKMGEMDLGQLKTKAQIDQLKAYAEWLRRRATGDDKGGRFSISTNPNSSQINIIEETP